MKNLKIYPIFASVALALCLIIPNTSYPYGIEGEGGHKGLTRKALALKRSLHASDDPDLVGKLEKMESTIVNCNAAEDDGSNSLSHFYNPDTGNGLGMLWGNGAIGYFPNAKERATRLYDEAMSMWNYDQSAAWCKLGHVMHLVQDMGVPAHATGSPHMLSTYFPGIFGYNYEQYVAANCVWEIGTVLFGEIGTVLFI